MVLTLWKVGRILQFGRMAAIIITTLQLVNASTFRTSDSSACTCPGYNSIYYCSVAGSGATIWRLRGSVLQSCFLVLRHSQFELGLTKICDNNEGVVAQTIGTVNGTYTSQLRVNVSEDLNGLSVECAHDAGSSIEVNIGSVVILLTTAAPLPPGDVSLVNIDHNQLIFSWSPVNTCSALHYNIQSSNCGNCSDKIVNSSVICNHSFSVSERVCTITVQPVVCGNIAGTSSAPLSVFLKIPLVEVIELTPEYNQGNILKTILLQFSEPDQFMIGTGFSGVALSYTIKYLNVVTGSTCGSATLPASLCRNGICNHKFDIAFSSCSSYSDVIVSISASNILGNGQARNSTLIYAVNRFVYFEFDLATSQSVKCNFVNKEDTSVKSCGISYSPAENCQNMSLNNQGNPTTSDSVEISLQVFEDYNAYCYTLIARNETNTIHVSGTFSTACNPVDLSDGINTVTSDITCPSATYGKLGIENGIVCYSGLEVGSTAIYYCLKCGYNDVMETGSLIRSCSTSGEWNGTIPKCNCRHASTSDVVVYSAGISSCFVLLIIILVLFFILIIVVKSKANARLRADLARERAEKILYEEINLEDMANVDTNIAYSPVSIKN